MSYRRLSLPLVAALLVSSVWAQQPIKVQIEDMFEHRIGSPGVIRSDAKLSYPEQDYVELDVVVDAEGRVESAHAIKGPQQFFEQAEEIEAKRKFKPFQKDGEAVRAAFQDYVSIVPPEKWAETRVPFPEIKDWNSLRMGLKRTRCFGACPAYSVEVRGDGGVEFNGESNVLITGHHHDQVSSQAVRDLFAAFHRADYFSLNDRYHSLVTDNPTYTTWIEFDGQKKSVVDYVGLHAGMPEVVQDLERAIDEISGTDKWVKGNEQTGAALVAEKWDFRADTEENRALFANAVERGNRDLTELFVQHGAPALSMSARGQSPLISAAAKGDLALVEQFIGNVAELPAPLSTCALGAAARSGNLALVQFLNGKGAEANAPACPTQGKFTVLMNAVQSGKADVVREILKYQPDMNAKDFNGDTALALISERTSEKDSAKTIIDLLLAAGADVNSRNNNEETPIFKACYIGPEAILALAKAGADLNLKNRNGQTAIMACFGNESVRAMIEAGADLTIRSRNGLTAAEEARKMGAAGKAEVLEAAEKARLK